MFIILDINVHDANIHEHIYVDMHAPRRTYNNTHIYSDDVQSKPHAQHIHIHMHIPMPIDIPMPTYSPMY